MEHSETSDKCDINRTQLKPAFMPTLIYDTITFVPESYFKTEPIFPLVQAYVSICNVEGLIS